MAATATTTISSTNPPALTTTFTAPTQCFQETHYIENLSGTDYYTTTVTTGLTGWWLDLGPTDYSTCFPTGYDINTEFYYSPGLCPSGYWAARQSVYSLSEDAEETRATCCPNNYNAQTRSDLDWFTTNACTSRADSSSVWTFTQGTTVTSLTTTADGINAKGVFIRWQSTDFASKTLGDAQVTTSPTPTSTLSSSSESTADPHATGSSGLSTGAKAGIGVGVSVGTILILTIGVLLWMLRKKSKNPENSPEGSVVAQHSFWRAPWRPPVEIGGPVPATEMPTERLSRSSQDEIIHELGMQSNVHLPPPVELPTKS